MKLNVASLLVAGLMAAAAPPAQALVQIWDGCCGAHLVQDFAPTATIFAQGDENLYHLTGRYLAGAGSNLANGSVSGWIDARRTELRAFGPLQVHTWADVGDTVTVHGAAPVDIEFTYTVTGSFEIGAVGGLYATSDFYVGSAATVFRILWGSGPSEPTALYYTNGVVTGIDMTPSSLRGTIHIVKTVTPEVPFFVGARLQLEADPSRHDYAIANFGHTGLIGIHLPPGYSFTSASGEFLSRSPVPEPSTALLLAAGLAGLAATARRTRRAKASAT